MSILAHPQWSEIRLYLRAEAYDRDTNKAGDVRHRIEVVLPDDLPTRGWLLAIMMPCVTCGQPMHPVRLRATWGTCYYSASCPKSFVCRNNKATADEYRAIKEDLQGIPPEPSTPLLF